MTYRTDKFVPGDKVTWANDDYANLFDGREKYGDGPFIVADVIDRPYESYEEYYDSATQSNWDSMGHTQHLSVTGVSDSISGAFFKKADATI